MTRWMARFVRKSRIDKALLVEAIDRAEKGLIDADLGGGVIKQRVGRPGRGRSGGYRTLIAIRRGDRSIFVFAFAKNEIDNIGSDQLRVIKELAEKALQWSDMELQGAIADGRIEEIMNGR
ncbi:type II toxin-antitoxin system RelE/ParE family toxin [Rhizobium sp.]